MELGVIELVLGLFVVIVGLAYLARRVGVAYPILVVIGGLVLGFVPGVPEIELEPDLVFLVILPPILFGAGYSTPIRDFHANARSIGLLAIGLVLFTTVVVGLVAHALVPSMGVAAAFALGAIVAPPDAVAATSIFRRIGVPSQVVTILEGESLINDASALIAFRFAIAAAATGVFSLADASIAFVYVGVGGVLLGIVVGRLITFAWQRTNDPTLEIMVSLLAPFAAYLPAEAIGVSGVLAVVVAGLIAGRGAARSLSPDARLAGRSVWGIVNFSINGIAFVLIGLQLPSIVENLAPRSPLELIGLGVAISLTVIAARIAWVFPATYLPRIVSAGLREREPSLGKATVFVVSWAGMRGAVTLGAALALPLDPTAFPERDLMIFLAFCVILATLVGQGLTLPWLVRHLGVVESLGPDREEQHARLSAVEAAMARLTELASEYPDHLELVEQLRARYDHEAGHIWPRSGDERDDAQQEEIDHLEIRAAVVAAQREAVIILRDDGVISDDALRRIERDLDLEAIRAGI